MFLSFSLFVSALATLSVGSTYKAFALGIRWGLGHSTGLLLIAVIFLSLKDGQLNMHELEKYCSWIVGVFMMGMGLWSMYGIYLKKKNELAGTTKTDIGAVELGPIENEIHHEAQLTIKEDLEVISEEEVSVTSPKPAKEAAKSTLRIPTWEKLKEFAYKENPCMQKVVAFFVGIIHGIAGMYPLPSFADSIHGLFSSFLKSFLRTFCFSMSTTGPGGILGVLPAVELHDWGKSMLYLFSFIFTSTLAMGVSTPVLCRKHIIYVQTDRCIYFSSSFYNLELYKCLICLYLPLE